MKNNNILILLLLLNLVIFINIASAQNVPDKLSGTSWIGGGDNQGDLMTIEFNGNGTVYLEIVGEKKWTGTYKQNGKNVEAKFKSYVSEGDSKSVNSSLEFKGEYGRSQGGKTLLWITFTPKIENFSKDFFLYLSK